MADTIADNTSTTGAIGLGRSVYGTVDTNGDHDWYAIQLTAGTTYEFRLHGFGAGQVADPNLAVRTSSGAQLAFNDDAGAAQWSNSNRLDSFIQFTPTSTGTYYLDVGEFNSDATGEFLLTAVADNPAGMVFTVDEIAWQITNNYNEQGETLTRPYIWNIGGDGSLTVNITNLDANGQILARNALLAWTRVSGIDFIEVASGAEINFDDNAAGQVANAFWNINGTEFITSANVQISTGWLTEYGTSMFSYSFETYIHEIGHALGLGHGGNYDGSLPVYGTDNYYLNDSLAYSIMSYLQANDDTFGGAAINTFVDASFSFMLTPAMADIIAIRRMYQSQQVTIGDTTYGFNANTGNLVLDLAVPLAVAQNVEESLFMTIYDEGGQDTLDFSLTNVAQRIFLEAESFSNVLGGRMNLSIARDVEIENASSGGGTDLLVGNAVDNTLSGGGGEDVLIGGSGRDRLFGEAGNDRFQLIAIHTGDANEVYNGEFGIDRVQLFGFSSYTHNLRDDMLVSIEEIELTDPGDFQTSRVEIDASQIGAGAFAATGSVYGEIYDTVTDVFAIYLTTTASVSLGTMLFFNFLNPNDRIEITGDGDGETIFASNARDVIWAGGGNDTVFSFGGNDDLFGEAGTDTLNAGANNDKLYGGAGADTMNGEAGDDTFYMDADGAADAASGGDGAADALDLFSATSAVAVTFGAIAFAGTASGGGLGTDSFTGIERIYGSIFADTVTGGAGGEYVNARGGADTVYAGGGGDTVYGDTGADRIYGGAEGDTIHGGIDGDIWLGGDAGLDYITGGDGNDRIDGGADGDTWLGGDAGIDYITGGDGDDRIDGGADGDSWLGGGAGADYITGGDGNDRVDGGSGNNAWLGGGAGADYITGGDGDDRADGGTEGDNINGGAGRDYVTGGGGNDTITGGGEVGLGDTLSGDAGIDYIYGGLGDDRIDGGADGNSLNGEDGLDNLTGGLGVDWINGGGGVDYLEGGDGNDRLTGGAAADTFDFNVGTDYDSIVDFTNDVDTIRIDPGFGFATVAAVLAATIQSGNHARILLNAAGTDSVYLINYLAPGSGNTIANLGDDIFVG